MKNKTGIIIAIILNILIIAFFVTILIVGENGTMSILNLGMGEYEIKKEKEYDISQIQNLNIDFTSDSIYILESENEQLKIVQKARYNLKEEDMYTDTIEGNSLTIRGSRRFHIVFFGLGNTDSDIFVYLPKSYTKNLKVNLSSGRQEIQTALNLENVELTQTSGSFEIQKPIIANHLKIRSSSGSIKIQDKIETNNLNMKQTSGNMKIEKVIKAKEATIVSSSGRLEINDTIEAENLTITGTSGNISVEGTLKANTIEIGTSSGKISLQEIQGDKAAVKCTSGNIMIQKLENTENFDVRVSSGKIDIKQLIGAGILKTTSGNIQVSSFFINGNTNMETSSGNIKVGLKEGSNCIINATATSGKVRTPNDRNSYGVEPYYEFNVRTTSGNITIE